MSRHDHDEGDRAAGAPRRTGAAQYRVPETEVRTMSVSDPTTLSAPVEVYQWPDVAQFTVLLDKETNTWFMFYRNRDQNRYGVKTAPANGNTATSPPSQVTGLQAGNITATSVSLTWNPSTDENASDYRYRIYRNGSLAGTIRSNSFLDDGLSPGTTYTYKVSAITSDGVEGPKSAGRTVTTSAPPSESPSRVTGVTIQSVRSTSVSLVWKASTDPDSSSYTYRIYRGSQHLATTNGTSFTDRGVTAGTEYTYQVSAVNAAGIEGPKSYKIWVTTPDPDTEPPPPSKVTGFSIGYVDAHSVGLRWQVPADAEAAEYSYGIYRNGRLIAITRFTRFRDGGRSPSTTYRYHVSAFSADGIEGPKSLGRSATTPRTTRLNTFFADGLESGNLRSWSAVQR